jgi:hypothetical protein
VEAVAPVAGEDLVAAIAGQGDRDVPPRQRADGKGGHRGMVAEGLAEEPRLAAGADT